MTRTVLAPRLWLLTCVKTGRFWWCANEAMARRRALDLGLTDYTVDPPA